MRRRTRSYAVGDKLELIVPHCDPVVNEYDQLYAIRKDRVEAVWPIAARGSHNSAVRRSTFEERQNENENENDSTAF